MGRTPVILALTALTAFFSGCAGRVMDWGGFGVTPSAGCTELDEETLEAIERAVAKADWSERRRKLDDLQRSFADVAVELETLRLPCREQMIMVDALVGLPTPSEIASLPPPGPLEDEVYESLIRAAEAYQTCASVHADNMVNLNTTAFKQRQPVLEECVANSHGCRISEIRSDFRQGSFNRTDRNLDVAIEGQGCFIVIDPSTSETQYTRAGNFSVNADGSLVLGSASTGRLVEPQITIPPDTLDIVISAQGEVSVRQPGVQQLASVGTLELASFQNPEGLLRLGENLFAETDASGAATTGIPGDTGLGVLRQGSLEASNVEPVTELAALTRYVRMLRVMRWLLLAGHPESDLDIYYNVMRARAAEKPRPVSAM